MSDYIFIRKASELQTADHISWPTQFSSGILEHHAIVVAWKGDNNFKIIHLRTSGAYKVWAACGFGSSDCYSVIEEIVDFAEPIKNGQLRRYNYAANDCSEPVDVIENARKKRGKYNYNALTDNCEHFARLCKSGNKKSYQAEDAAIGGGVSAALAVTSGAVAAYFLGKK